MSTHEEIRTGGFAGDGSPYYTTVKIEFEDDVPMALGFSRVVHAYGVVECPRDFIRWIVQAFYPHRRYRVSKRRWSRALRKQRAKVRRILGAHDWYAVSGEVAA